MRSNWPSRRARAAYIEEACAGDLELQRRVQALLAAHEQSGDLLDPPEAGTPPSHHDVAAAADLAARAVSRPIIAEGPGTPHRALQAAATDRRRGHGRCLHGRTGNTRQAQGRRSR